MQKYTGIYVSILTPFNEDLEIDYETIKDQIDYVIEKGVHGIVACGVNGEFSSLTIEERKKVIKTSIDAVKGRTPIIAGAYSNSYKGTIDLIKYAEENGATASIITRPYFFRKPAEEGLYNYFSRIFNEIKKFPIFLCNVPIYTPMEFSTELIEKLLMKYKNIVGIKDLSGSTDIILKYTGTFEELSILVGSDRMVYNGLNAGCDGAVSAIANIFPEHLLKIYETYKIGDVDKAWSEQEALTGVRSLMQRYPSRAAQKFLFSKITGRETFVRPPLVNLTEEEKETLLIVLGDHGLQFNSKVVA
ncbi:MAG TPA: dihydrodipicolinate synthase family protein [Candidatus Bathyarchaeia archaeon]|nr:dihydrodipicolinate synthase family protein [Candidatus Bathyarchaeia archaeon]